MGFGEDCGAKAGLSLGGPTLPTTPAVVAVGFYMIPNNAVDDVC